jgi:hypothetical protein
MTWGGIASAAVGAATSIYSASQQKKAAKNAAAATAQNPYGVSTPFGSMSNNNGVLGYDMGQNPFSTMFQNVGMAGLANAGTAPGSFLNGASPELAAAYQGLTGPGIQEAASGRYDLLNQLAQPEMQRSQNQLQDTLFAQGRTGTTGGGIQQEAWQNAANQADLQRQLAAQDWATTQAQNRFQGALQAVGSGQQGQMNNFNIGLNSQNGLNSIFGNLLTAGAQGVGAGGGQAPGAAMMAAGMSTAPLQAGYGALQQGGVFDKLGGMFGNWMSSSGGGTPYQPTTTPTGAPVVGGSATNPYGIDFGPPKAGF